MPARAEIIRFSRPIDHTLGGRCADARRSDECDSDVGADSRRKRRFSARLNHSSKPPGFAAAADAELRERRAAVDVQWPVVRGRPQLLHPVPVRGGARDAAGAWPRRLPVARAGAWGQPRDADAGGFEGYFSIAQSHPLSRAKVTRVSDDPPRYERALPDGTIEVFTQPDRAAIEYNRRVFLTEIIDPQGHSLTYTYDSSLRLVAITDALGQVTTMAYEHGNPLLLTKVTDPFGRFATIGYDSNGRIQSLTDVANLTSTFVYGANDFISSMTTPYGTTTFRHEVSTFTAPRIEATDPVGGRERVEFHFSDTGLASADASNLVPTGFSSQNLDLNRYASLYWDKVAMAQDPGDPTRCGRDDVDVVLGSGGASHGGAQRAAHHQTAARESRVVSLRGSQRQPRIRRRAPTREDRPRHGRR
jgi:YD repeat-containing protein